MLSRVFVSAGTDDYRETRGWIAQELRQAGLYSVIQEELIELGQNPLVKLAESIQTESDLVLHIIGPHTGSVPSPHYFPPLLAHCGESAFRRRFPRLFAEDAFRRLTYTQWEAWLALFYDKHLLPCLDATEAGEPPESAAACREAMSAAEHLALLGAESGRAIRFSGRDELKDKLKTALIRLYKQRLHALEMAGPRRGNGSPIKINPHASIRVNGHPNDLHWSYRTSDLAIPTEVTESDVRHWMRFRSIVEKLIDPVAGIHTLALLWYESATADEAERPIRPSWPSWLWRWWETATAEAGEQGKGLAAPVRGRLRMRLFDLLNSERVEDLRSTIEALPSPLRANPVIAQVEGVPACVLASLEAIDLPLRVHRDDTVTLISRVHNWLIKALPYADAVIGQSLARHCPNSKGGGECLALPTC